MSRCNQCGAEDYSNEECPRCCRKQITAMYVGEDGVPISEELLIAKIHAATAILTRTDPRSDHRELRDQAAQFLKRYVK